MMAALERGEAVASALSASVARTVIGPASSMTIFPTREQAGRRPDIEQGRLGNRAEALQSFHAEP
jgi:hypothetical protein